MPVTHCGMGSKRTLIQYCLESSCWEDGMSWDVSILCLVDQKIRSSENGPVMGKCQAVLTVSTTASFIYDVCDILLSNTMNTSTFLELCVNQLHEQPYRLLVKLIWKIPFEIVFELCGIWNISPSSNPLFKNKTTHWKWEGCWEL